MPKKFQLKFNNNKLSTGGRKKDSNYFRRRVAKKKIAYITHFIHNIEQLVIVASLDFPLFKAGLIDRFIVLALYENIKPIIILTKKDLVSENFTNECLAIYQNYFEIHALSNQDDSIIFNQLKENIFKNTITAIVGHSGVGKTTLLNNIDPVYQGKTQEISTFTKKGRHTTTKIYRYDFSFGGIFYDMPGLKELDFISLTQPKLKQYYHEFREYQRQCKYKNCTHTHETACGIKKAVAEKYIHPTRYQNYLQIFNDLEKY